MTYAVEEGEALGVELDRCSRATHRLHQLEGATVDDGDRTPGAEAGPQLARPCRKGLEPPNRAQSAPTAWARVLASLGTGEPLIPRAQRG